MIIIGMAGTHGSGKDTIADLLVEKYQFFHVSTGDLVREVAQEKYGSVERPVLYKTANELRNEYGHGVLSQLALEHFDKVKDRYRGGLIVTGLRAAAEAQVLKDAGGKIVFVDAPQAVRFERMNKRAREKEAGLTPEEFQKREDDENGGVDPAFNIQAIKDISDLVIDNNFDSIDEFKASVESTLDRSGFLN